MEGSYRYRMTYLGLGDFSCEDFAEQQFLVIATCIARTNIIIFDVFSSYFSFSPFSFFSFSFFLFPCFHVGAFQDRCK